MKLSLYIICVTLLALATSCSNELSIKSVNVYPTTLTIVEGDSIRVTATIDFLGGNFNEPNFIRLNWSSENNDIAIVDNTGYVKAISAGSTNIVATCENKSSKCTITVVNDTTNNTEYQNILP